MKKVYILTEEQLDTYYMWHKMNDYKHDNMELEDYKQWLKDNPNPLPEMVSVPSEEECRIKSMEKETTQNIAGSVNGFYHGAKWLLNLLNLNS